MIRMLADSVKAVLLCVEDKHSEFDRIIASAKREGHMQKLHYHEVKRCIGVFAVCTWLSYHGEPTIITNS